MITLRIKRRKAKRSRRRATCRCCGCCATLLGLTGTKFGCGMALCGACTVHVDGEAVALLPDAGRRRRRQGGHHYRRPRRRRQAHAVQQAWLEARRAAMRLLPVRADHVGGGAADQDPEARPTPTSTQAMTGNICRCGTYLRIREAIQRAAKPA